MDEAVLKENQKFLAQNEPDPSINVALALPEGIVDWFKDGLSLLKHSIVGNVLEEFQAHRTALRWVEEGYDYHESHSLTDCLLCGSQISSDRMKLLKTFFDKTWKDTVKQVEDAVGRGQTLKEGLEEYYRSLPKEANFAVELRSQVGSVREATQASIEKIGVFSKELLKCLRERVANPAEETPIPADLKYFDFSAWWENHKEVEKSLLNLISAHNDIIMRFAAVQKDAFKRIEEHILASHQAEWNRLSNALKQAGTEKDSNVALEARLTEELLKLRNALEDHGIGAERLNDLIHSYLGHTEIRLISVSGAYRIVRPDGEPASHLSEGERTALAFCYFLTQLESEGRKLDDLVLVIDDPISSLDTSARTHAFSLLTRSTKKCAQVIVLTHNTSFMNLIKRHFKNLAKQRGEHFASFLWLDCKAESNGRGRTTTLTKMHKLLTDFDSEYHYLFSLIWSAANNGATDYTYLLPNATRKLLEMFVAYCSPGQPSFADALGEYTESLKGEVDIKALERLVNVESHATIDGLSHLPDLTLEEAINAATAAIKFIKKVGKDHHKKMEAICKQVA